jgi:hypothetical protein
MMRAYWQDATACERPHILRALVDAMTPAEREILREILDVARYEE